MKIAHLCLSCFYFDGFSYQENLLVKQNILDGHDAIIIASLESINEKGEIIFLEPSIYEGKEKALVYRVPYNKNIPKFAQHKIRSYEGVFEILNTFKPDVIYFHGISAYELITVRNYINLNTNVKFIVDVHSDKNNSATNWFSKNILHKIFYKNIFNLVVNSINKVFCCSMEAMDFAVDYYGAPKEKLVFYPLGGFCLEDDEYNAKRIDQRKQLGLTQNNIMFLQTGKINKKKKLIESLENFIKVHDDSFVYIIAGSLEDDIKDEALRLIDSDKRINYIGWVDAEKIENLLCASDIYIQPGSQSATMQQSLCLRNPVVLANVKSHHPFVDRNGWLIDGTDELHGIFSLICKDKNKLAIMSDISFGVAREMLDYKKLAGKIYEL